MRCGASLVIEAEAVYDGLIALEPEKARFWISRLRPRRDGTDLDEAKAEAQQGIRYLRVLVETGGKTDRVGELESEGTHGQFLAVGRCLDRRHEAQRVDRQPVRVLRVQRAQEWA